MTDSNLTPEQERDFEAVKAPLERLAHGEQEDYDYERELALEAGIGNPGLVPRPASEALHSLSRLRSELEAARAERDKYDALSLKLKEESAYNYAEAEKVPALQSEVERLRAENTELRKAFESDEYAIDQAAEVERLRRDLAAQAEYMRGYQQEVERLQGLNEADRESYTRALKERNEAARQLIRALDRREFVQDASIALRQALQQTKERE